MTAPVIHLRREQHRRHRDWQPLVREEDVGGGLIVFLWGFVFGIATGVLLFAAVIVERFT